MEALKSHLKVRESHNGAVGYHPGLTEAAPLEKHNVTRNTTNKEQRIEANIKAREKYLTCLFLSGVDNLRYKQLKN